jgi:pimeloyl-ACP methyl ester carboxylesterase
VLGRLTAELNKMPRETWPVIASHWSNPHFYHGMVAHLKAVPAAVLEMRNAAPIEHAPVVLLTPHSAEPLSADSLRRIGAKTQQIIAHGSGHWIHLDEPELVRGAILAMMEQHGLRTHRLIAV